MRPLVTWYRPSDWYWECGGPPVFSRAELARVKRWLDERAQLALEAQ